VPGPKAPAQPISRRVAPDEVLPADLDVVVRVDLARLKEVLGPDPEKLIAERLGTDPAVEAALKRGRSATLGLRAGDIETGDHVLVVEGDMKSFEVDRSSFTAQPGVNDRVKVFTRTTATTRRGTEVLVVLDERAVAFASPAEADAVLRVVREGADPKRGQPAAEGLLSFDLRPQRLPTDVERRFPSVARLLSQVQRVRGVVHVESEALVVRLEVVTQSEASADRVARFLAAFRDDADPTGASAVLKKMEIEKVGAAVTVRLPVPALLVVSAIRGE
jgi:hypothetical protein